MMPQMTRFPISRRSLAAMALTAALTPVAALADSKQATISDLETPFRYVESNGSEYTEVPGLSNIVAEVRAVVDTGNVGRVVSWRVELRLTDEDGVGPIFSNHAVGDSYGVGERPRRIDLLEPVIIPESEWGAFVTARCNLMADDLRDQGLGDTAIFAQDRSYELALIPVITANTNGAGSGNIIEEGTSWSGEAKVTIICKKWSGAQIPQVGNTLSVEPPKVVNKGLSILERHGATGVCKIRLDGWITTDQKNVDVSFRYRNQAGNRSQVWTVNTGESKTANFSHWYDIPNTEWAETGFVRMIGVSHDFRSDWAEYTMECVEGGPDTLTANSPPKLKVSFVPQGKVMVFGQICPERLKIVGLIEGRGPSSGYAGFVSKSGYTYISPPQEYSVSHGDKVLIGADYEIDWGETPPPPGQLMRTDPHFDFNVTNENDVVVASRRTRAPSPCAGVL